MLLLFKQEKKDNLLNPTRSAGQHGSALLVATYLSASAQSQGLPLSSPKELG
jgi:hypothetical protein